MKCASLAMVVLIALCGCSLLGSSKPDAMDMGGGLYSVSGTTLSGNLGSAREAAAEEASEFCGNSSRQAVIQSFQDKARGDAWGARTSSAIFYCR
jgi:hypothetical protein